jgi:hypothetical protein
MTLEDYAVQTVCMCGTGVLTIVVDLSEPLLSQYKDLVVKSNKPL